MGAVGTKNFIQFQRNFGLCPSNCLIVKRKHFFLLIISFDVFQFWFSKRFYCKVKYLTSVTYAVLRWESRNNFILLQRNSDLISFSFCNWSLLLFLDLVLSTLIARMVSLHCRLDGFYAAIVCTALEVTTSSVEWPCVSLPHPETPR